MKQINIFDKAVLANLPQDRITAPFKSFGRDVPEAVAGVMADDYAGSINTDDWPDAAKPLKQAGHERAVKIDSEWYPA